MYFHVFHTYHPSLPPHTHTHEPWGTVPLHSSTTLHTYDVSQATPASIYDTTCSTLFTISATRLTYATPRSSATLPTHHRCTSSYASSDLRHHMLNSTHCYYNASHLHHAPLQSYATNASSPYIQATPRRSPTLTCAVNRSTSTQREMPTHHLDAMCNASSTLMTTYQYLHLVFSLQVTPYHTYRSCALGFVVMYSTISVLQSRNSITTDVFIYTTLNASPTPTLSLTLHTSPLGLLFPLIPAISHLPSYPRTCYPRDPLILYPTDLCYPLGTSIFSRADRPFHSASNNFLYSRSPLLPHPLYP
ncbi:hypothetical protein Pcinc_006926 [Petrolisthes cinctipes]|uniref:Uncharacterized protein n=1 Tax=Petrolisthes cinctipes TaxID=88211 RepID=A0AAE1GAD9_PETCI|nr:hypothetical protein Pcinc_006926 [Petrolisthes cinctipes]